MANVPGIILIAFLATALNAILFHHGVIGFILLAIWLGVTAVATGGAAFPREKRAAQVAGGALLTIAQIAVLGSILYYAAPVTTLGLLAVLAVPTGVAMYAMKFAPTPVWPVCKFPTRATPDAALIAIGIVGLAAWWSATSPLMVDGAVRSPWLVASPTSILALAIALSASALLLHRRHSAGIPLFIGTLFSAITLAAFLYPLGYGFDPFLHRATVAHIAEHGTITPKPFYYIGQYALELVGHKIFALPLFWVDVLLVPLVATLTLWFGAALLRDRLHALALAFAPLGMAIATTPQSLGYCFMLVTLFVMRLPHTPRWIAPFFAIAAFLTHPLAGIPTVVFVILSWIADIAQPIVRRILLTLGTTAAALMMPLVFAVQAKLAGLNLGFAPSNLLDITRLPLTGFLANNYNTWKDALYLVVDNLMWIVVLLAIPGMLALRRSDARWYVPALLTLALFINFYVLSTAFDFTYLISYERTDFALRLLTLAQLFLLPYIAVTLGNLFDVLRRQPALFAVAIALTAAIFAGNVYGAYPRHDDYARSAGFNVSQADIDAAYAIQTREGDNDYIVLSNQTVAAAAVQEFGFRRYYHGDIFYYPIPTGGPLYQKYLSMVEEAPTRATIEDAMDLAGVSTAYFVINEYWWQADRIIENAKREADEWVSLNNGAITIFRYSR